MTIINAYITDQRGVYLRTEAIDSMDPQPPGAVYVEPPEQVDGYTLMWVGGAWVQVLDAEVPPLPVPGVPPPATRITRLAFRNRFTQAEKVQLEMASIDNPAGTTEQRQQAAAIRVYLADVAASTFIDLQRADTRAGVQSLEAAGLLAAGRALQILDTPISPSEAYSA